MIPLKLRVEGNELFLYKQVGSVDKMWTMHSLPNCEFSLVDPPSGENVAFLSDGLIKKVDSSEALYKLIIRLSESHKRVFFIQDGVTAHTLLAALKEGSCQRRLD